MHILHIYKDYYPVFGGIENHVRDLSEGLVARGHRVTVLVTNTSGRTQIEQPQPGLTVIKAARLLHTASTPLSVAMLVWARQLRPDVAHLQFPYPPGDLAYWALPARPPLVVTYQSDIVRQQTLLHLYRPLMERTLQQATRIVASSPNYIASSPVLQRYAAKCSVVPLGIVAERFTSRGQGTGDRGQGLALSSLLTPSPLHPFTPSSLHPGTVLFVGRLRYYKGLHILLDALPLVQAHLLIAGTGPERERLEAQAVALGVHDRVEFLGDVSDDDLPALYRAADVFVLPAHLRAEAYGLVQLEAMASGVPVISTELGTGTSYINQDGETGLVVPPNNPNALATALNTLLYNAELRRRMGEAGRQRVLAHFARERMIEGVEQVYQQVTSQS